MLQENQTQRLLELIEEKKFFEVRAILQESNEVDIADLFDELKDEHLLLVYRLLPKETAAAAFAYLEPETQERLISVFSDKELSFVLDELYMDDVADLIEELPASVVKRVLRAVSSEERSLINQLMRYPEESAGSVLTTEFVDLKANMTIAQAFAYIRSYGPDKETIYTCYVTDDQRHLQGVLSVKELLLANSDQLVGSLMETNVIFAYTTDDQEEVA
ncbi:MAG: magnesium transporter, partial [Oscillospiraceae bacterium]|nr:magnesium transporter [Oscillospiraceae bacterium]